MRSSRFESRVASWQRHDSSLCDLQAQKHLFVAQDKSSGLQETNPWVTVVHTGKATTENIPGVQFLDGNSLLMHI